MKHDPARLERLGFSRAATAIALRSAGTCPYLGFQPLARPVIGIGMLSVTPRADAGYAFQTCAMVLRDGALPGTLADWLEPRLPETGAIISWEPDGSLPWKLRGLIDPVRHCRIAQFAHDPGERLRALSAADMRARPKAQSPSVPCFCRDSSGCAPQLPAFFLPDPDRLEAELIGEAEAAWCAWAGLLAPFDAADHPARAALRALREWKPAAPEIIGI